MNNILNKNLLKEPLDLEIEEMVGKIDMMFSMLKDNVWTDTFSKDNIENMMKTGIVNKEILQIEKFGLRSMAIHLIRDLYVQHYGFVAINENFIDDLSSIIGNDRVLEVGAGTGFLAKNLQDKGINLIPVDNSINDMEINENSYGFRKTFTNIVETDAKNYLKENLIKFDTILMVWPPLGESLSSDIFKEMNPGQKLIYIGEGSGGCTGNDEFFQILKYSATQEIDLSKKANKNFVSFPLIKDKVYIYTKEIR